MPIHIVILNFIHCLYTVVHKGKNLKLNSCVYHKLMNKDYVKKLIAARL